jgi:hypothetical protein
MDEISLKSHLFYGCSKGKVIGLEDLVDGTTSNQLATSAIVLMTRCFMKTGNSPLLFT